MGNYKSWTGIDCYEPDNDENFLYIPCYGDSFSFSEIYDRIREHFKIPFDPLKFTISCDKIHTNAIYYDLHDPSDYTNYLIIERITDE